MANNRSKAVKKIWKYLRSPGESLHTFAKRIAEDKDFRAEAKLVRSWWEAKR